jgi:hypothetical protein
MSKKVDEQRLNEAVEVIQENPDHKPGWFATLLGRDDKGFQRDLVHLEERGDLLQEDDHGRIRWFGRRRD